MINAKRANTLLWTCNFALIFGIASITLNSFILRESSNRVVESDDFLPPMPLPIDVRDTGPLSSLPNPIRDSIRAPQNEAVCLIGIDSMAGDPNAATAYLFLAGRNLFVNAYVGEPIRDGATGREVSELLGWRLKEITSKGAVFSTPKGELILDLAQGRALLATATSSFKASKL